MGKIKSIAGEWGLDYCNECPFMGYNKKKKQFECCPNGYFFSKKEIDNNGNIKVPNWCGNKKYEK